MENEKPMQYRIPTQLKEKITVVRKSAFERQQETHIATDVVCMIVPRTDVVQVVDGAGISDVEWVALLEIPNPDIVAGDVIRRADGTELQIMRVRPLGSVGQLELKDTEII